jgi:hypothetical protein
VSAALAGRIDFVSFELQSSIFEILPCPGPGGIKKRAGEARKEAQVRLKKRAGKIEKGAVIGCKRGRGKAKNGLGRPRKREEGDGQGTDGVIGKQGL